MGMWYTVCGVFTLIFNECGVFTDNALEVAVHAPVGSAFSCACDMTCFKGVHLAGDPTTSFPICDKPVCALKQTCTLKKSERPLYTTF